MSDLKMVVETDRDIGTREAAEVFLGVLSRHPRFLPQRFGVHEPLRTAYDPGDHDSFIHVWLGEPIQPDYWVGNILIRRTKAIPYFGSVSWVRGQRRMNSVAVTIPDRHVSAGVVDETLALGQDLFCALGGQYGYACDWNEYVEKNMTGWWVHPETGRRQGGKHHGHDRTRHLPGVCWANFFGPAYVEFFGEERLEGAPAFAKERLPCGGWLLFTASSPGAWDRADTRLMQEHLKDHLGRDAFFALAHPDRPTVAPKLALFTSVGGRRGGVTVRPIAQDYVSTPDEASWFIEHVLELVGRLQSRVPASQKLDLTPESLKYLDAVGQRIRKRLSGDGAHRALVIEVAAYYGEVVRRGLEGQWQLGDSCTPIVAIPKYGTPEDPIVRAVKFVEDDASLSNWFDLIRRGGEKLLQ